MHCLAVSVDPILAVHLGAIVAPPAAAHGSEVGGGEAVLGPRIWREHGAGAECRENIRSDGSKLQAARCGHRADTANIEVFFGSGVDCQEASVQALWRLVRLVKVRTHACVAHVRGLLAFAGIPKKWAEHEKKSKNGDEQASLHQRFHGKGWGEGRASNHSDLQTSTHRRKCKTAR